MSVILVLGLYLLGCAACFIAPYMSFRKLWNELYGEPTKDTLWTGKHYPGKRQIVIVIRERGMEEYDTVAIRTPRWDEVAMAIPKPIPSSHS